MKRFFLSTVFGLLISSLALGPVFSATEIRMTGMYTSSGLGVTGDHRLGNTCVTSTGGRTYCGLNASHLSFFVDNTVSLERLYQFARVYDNGVTGYCLKSAGDNTFYWGVCGTGGATTSLPWDNITGTDNALVPGKLKATGTPDNTMVPYWDNSGQFRWAAPSGTGTPAGSTGQLQYNDNGAFAAIPGTGFDPNDNTTKFPGPVESADPGNGYRRITLLVNTSYTCAANENSVLMLIDNSVLKFAGCINGQLVAFNHDNVAVSGLPVTDNFTRANEDPLGNGHWSKIPGWDNNLKIASNTLVNHVESVYEGAYWSDNAVTFNDNQYSVITINSGANAYRGLWVRLTGTSSVDGYMAQLNSAAQSANIFSYSAGVQGSSIGSTTSLNQAAGVRYRLKAQGTTITLDEDAGGGWVNKITATNADHASGRPGIVQYTSTDGQISAFEAGNN